MLCNIAETYSRMGDDDDKALEFFQQAADKYKQGGNAKREAQVLIDMGDFYKRSLQDLENAAKYYKKALVCYQEAGDKEGESTVLRYLGWLYRSAGNTEEASELLARSESIKKEVATKKLEAATSKLADARKHQDRKAEARALQAMAGCYRDLGNQKKALEVYENALEIFVGLDDTKSQRVIHNLMGFTHGDLHNFQDSIECFQKAVAACRKLNDKNCESLELNNIRATKRQRERFIERSR
jgi:tetratricopeptide (TPR) repeat protein